MRLLWVKTDLLHPVNSGGRIRTYEMLREIRKHHDVRYLALDDGSTAPEALKKFGEYATSIDLVPQARVGKHGVPFFADLAKNLFSADPYVLDRYRSPELARRIAHASAQGEIDVLVCDFLFPARDVPQAIATPKVLFQHNVEARIWERHAQVGRTFVHRAYFGSQYKRMKEAERQLCGNFDWVVAVSEDDAEVFRNQYGIQNVSSIPTGVNTEVFTVSDPAKRKDGSIVFLGSMDWMPNIDGVRWFVREVLPAVRQEVPHATVNVVGRNPAPEILALAELDGVTVSGTVPDVRPYLNEASVFVVPLRVGGGTRLKIYEGMATGIATLSTTIGAEGLPLEPGKHIRVADDATAMARATIEMLQDPTSTNAMGLAAAEYVRANFGWSGVALEFMRICELAREHARERSHQRAPVALSTR